MNTDPKAPTQISQEEEEVEAAGEVAASDLFEERAIHKSETGTKVAASDLQRQPQYANVNGSHCG